MLITEDNFVWKKINSEQATKIFEKELFDIYIVDENEVDSLVTELEEIERCDGFLYIEVGHLKQ